ncbi:type VI secretion system protein ImpL [Geomonas limicola]|uniref:Type VI secretion system protein ImpL n=1 Tax=Geomonas limicola TaxID=2740186 RepID=A0A6V8N2Z6_9BACT|nr:type VI secretion protein IcmF/TssM N-terminal domain-containing protein [Geomonas limicola]GFO66908.1 type VI secretion system protein ImpL [Geomonas limicola]
MQALRGTFGTSLRWFLTGTLLFLTGCAFALVVAWPWWVGACLALTTLGLALGVLILVRFWRRRRGAPVAEEPESADTRAALEAKDADLRSVEHWFAAGVAALRRTQLKRLGNPLDALPWYLVLGPTGAGKSTALKEARLAAPIPEPTWQEESAAPWNWSFLERAVLLDLPGCYASATGSAAHRHKWHRLVALLARHRKKPVNGVLLMVGADHLWEATAEQLEEDALTVRQRIDELMGSGRVRIPVYLVVTRCDLIPGFGDLSRLLPPGRLGEPMGELVREPAAPNLVVAGLVEALQERLRSLRPVLLARAAADPARSAVFELPEAFGQLQLGLENFAGHCFGTSPYRETPLLRGIFFTASALEAAPGPDASAGQRRCGLFLHDLLGSLIPADQAGLRHTESWLRWRRGTWRLALGGTLALSLALSGLLTFSFVKNLEVLRSLGGLAAVSPSSGSTPGGAARLERFRQGIVEVEAQNRAWWLPRLGLTASLKVEEDLKGRYCREFRQTVLNPLDEQLQSTAEPALPSSSDADYGRRVMYLVRRANLVRQALLVRTPEQLARLPQPDFVPLQGPTSASGVQLATLYRYYIAWNRDRGAVGEELARLQGSVKRQLAARGGRLEWCLAYLEQDGGIPGVTLKEFWGGSREFSAAPTVAGPCTGQGRQAVAALLDELETTLPDRQEFARTRGAFLTWYQGKRWEAWYRFAAQFGQGSRRLAGRTEWQQVAARMATDQGPYFALVNRIEREVGTDGQAPDWLATVREFGRIRREAQTTAGVNRMAETGKLVLTTVRKSAGQQAGAERLEAEVATARAGRDYLEALAALAAASASRSESFRLLAQAYQEDPATGTSSLAGALRAAARLKKGLPQGGGDTLAATLVSGPLDYLLGYLRREGASQLQELWEEQVLAATQGLSGQQAAALLLGPDGAVWRFVKGPAAPFLTASLSGFRLRELTGASLPIDAALLRYLGKGVETRAAVAALAKPVSYPVGIRGLPTDSNRDAKVRPHATRLELLCSGSSQQLVNQNYPVARTFQWSPENCSDVTLQIEVGDLVLTRHYPGAQGLPDFLRDVQGGRRSFPAHEFPSEQQALKRLGVKTITVNYQITGSAPLLRQAVVLSGQAPRVIAQGW